MKLTSKQLDRFLQKIQDSDKLFCCKCAKELKNNDYKGVK
jgi:hypothetical protein